MGCKECGKRVRTIADKSAESKRVRIADGMWVSHPYTWMYPSIECPSDLCEYHWNIKRCAKVGFGRQS